MLKFSDAVTGALEFSIQWSSRDATHEERFLARKINPSNDIFPRGMREALEGKGEGESVTLQYEPRFCIPRHKDSLVRTRPMDRLRKKTVDGRPIVPRIGRFYPQGHIDGLLDIYPDTLTPFRLVDLDNQSFVADCNHPLATTPFSWTVRIQYLAELHRGSYGALTHWREAACDWGPGMQARLQDRDTDFYTPDFFTFTGPTDTARGVIDARAQENMDAALREIVEPGMRVLVDGKPDTGMYDAAVFRCSLERMTDPVKKLRMVADLLPTGSPVVVMFSDMQCSDAVFAGWREMYNGFERMGLVLDLLRQAGICKNQHTLSIRNDWRNQNDPCFVETRGISDPVFVVTACK